MPLKPINFDSSSDEDSKENYTLPQHLDFLLRNILNINYISTSEGLKLRLGLMLHDLTKRVVEYSAIRNIYKKIKSEILTLDNDYYEENFNIIKTAFNKHFNELFKDDNKENISDKDYQKLLHFIFNPHCSLPNIFTLKKSVTTEHVKKVLLEELQNSNINLKSISKNPLNFTINNTKELLAFAAKMIDRNNKNQLKHRILEETNSDLSTICNISNTKEETFTINHIVHYKTGNVQTEVPGLGKYGEILSKIEQEHKYKHAIIERVFGVVRTKASTQNIEELPRKLNYFAEKLAHLLFIVEMHRNNTTLFTAPMFLELIDKNSIFLSDKEFFPMSAPHTIAQIRGILKSYKYVLPNSRPIDYDTTNVQNGNLLLVKEGNILIEWLSEKLNNYKLANIALVFDNLALIQNYKSKNIDNIKINDIRHFLEKVNKLEHCPTDLLNSLNKNLTALVCKVGERNLKFTKTKLLEKKDFSQDLKDLIEITYLEFTESLKNIEGFLAQKKETLKKDIKKILPEILQILCDKIKEWYDIDAPEYTKDVLKDITAKFNQTISPSSSRKRLKISISKKRDIYNENDDDSNQTLETTDIDVKTTAIDDSMKEYFKLIGEHTNITYD